MSKKSEFISSLCLEQKNRFTPFWELEFHMWNSFSEKPFIIGEEFHSQICLCENFDIGTLVMETPEDIYTSATQLLKDCASSGSYVFGCSNAVQQEVPKENLLALVNAYKDFTKKEV